MSRSTLYGFQVDGLTKACEPRKIIDLHNAWLFAPSIWDALCAKHCPDLDHRKKWDRLWSEPRLPLAPFERISLESTYNRALVRAADIDALEQAYLEFERVYPLPPDCLPRHLLPIITHARVWLQEFPETVAFGFRGSSVGENLWWVRELCPCCGGNEHDAEGRAYDLQRDTGHFFVEMNECYGELARNLVAMKSVEYVDRFWVTRHVAHASRCECVRCEQSFQIVSALRASGVRCGCASDASAVCELHGIRLR